MTVRRRGHKAGLTAATAALSLLVAGEAKAQGAPATYEVPIDLRAEIVDPQRQRPVATISVRLSGYEWQDPEAARHLVVVGAKGEAELLDPKRPGGAPARLPLTVKAIRREGAGGLLKLEGDGSRRWHLVADVEFAAEGSPPAAMELDAVVLVPPEGLRRAPKAEPLRPGIKPALAALAALRDRGEGGELRYAGPLFGLPAPRKPWVGVVRLAEIRAVTPRAAAAGREADRLIARLQYVAADYRYVVKDGEVLDQEEYGEQLAVLSDTVTLAEQLGLPRAVRDALFSIRGRVEGKTPPEEVYAACKAVIRDVADAVGPALVTPSIAELGLAAATFAEKCVPCHGAQGDGKGPASKGMDPPPASFRDPAFTDLLSPRRAFHAISYGMPGTAMPAQGALSDKARWGLAFYVFSYRHDEATATAGARAFARAGVAVPSLEELAIRTDRDLNAWLAARLPPADVAPALAYLRTTGLFIARSEPPSAAAAPAAPPPAPAAPPPARGLDAVPKPVQLLVAAALAALVLLLARRSVARVGDTRRLEASQDAAGAPAPRGLPAWLTVLGIALALAGGLITYRFLGTRAPAVVPETGPFDLTVRIEGPAMATGGMVILHLDDRQEMAMVALGQAHFKGIPAAYRGKRVKVVAITEPEFEATWRPEDLFALDAPVLTLRMLAERPPFQVVLLYKPPGAVSAEARVLDRLSAGTDDITVSALVQHSIAAFNATGAALPGDAEFTPISLKKRRWLEGTTSVESLDLDDSTIVLVHSSMRVAGDRPEDYGTAAEAAIKGR